MAGLLAYSFFERLPVNGEWKKYKAIFSPYSLNSGKSIVQKIKKSLQQRDCSRFSRLSLFINLPDTVY
jgi:hypothetical protein